MFQHRLRVVIGDQEGDVVSLPTNQHPKAQRGWICTHGYRLPPQHDEAFCSLHHEAREFVTENLLDLIRLLDFDADSDRVDGGFDVYTFIFVARDCQRVK